MFRWGAVAKVTLTKKSRGNQPARDRQSVPRGCPFLYGKVTGPKETPVGYVCCLNWHSFVSYSKWRLRGNDPPKKKKERKKEQQEKEREREQQKQYKLASRESNTQSKTSNHPVCKFRNFVWLPKRCPALLCIQWQYAREDGTSPSSS